MATQQEYWAHVEDLAREIITESKEYDRDIDDVMHEYIDGDAWVIYTFRAQKVIEYSPNDCEYFDNMGPVEVRDWTSLFTASAYFALRADVYEAIQEGPEIEGWRHVGDGDYVPAAQLPSSCEE